MNKLANINTLENVSIRFFFCLSFDTVISVNSRRKTILLRRILRYLECFRLNVLKMFSSGWTSYVMWQQNVRVLYCNNFPMYMFSSRSKSKFFVVTFIQFLHGSSENWMLHEDVVTFLIFKLFFLPG